MIGLSTCWKSGSVVSGTDLVDELISMGVDGLELDYRIPSALFADMMPSLKTTRVFSVHNYFPVPDILLPSQGSGDAFFLSAADEEERKLAIDYTVRSLRAAGELEARYLVVHLGEVDCGLRGRALIDMYKEGEGGGGFDKARSQLIKEREEKEEYYLGYVSLSLERVLEEAEKIGVLVCIENRYYPHQIPSFEEVGQLIERFDGGPIRYWHDVGHAVVMDHLGFTPHQDWLRRYGDHLAGVHFHDVAGLRDHLAPGQGDVRFEDLLPLIREEIVKIVEVHPNVKSGDLIEGMNYLRGLFGE